MNIKATLPSAFWVAGNQSAQILVRLVSTIILSRLLMPEAFGEILIVLTITALVDLISDVGLRGSIINNSRGASDEGYVNTVWTLKVIRGGFLAFLLILISFLSPVIYPKFDLLPNLLLVAAFNAFVFGFVSTRLFQAEKSMQMMRPALMQFVSRVLAVASMVLFASFEPTAYSIIWGETVSVSLMVLLSHTYLSGTRNYFHIERESLGGIFRYGRWIFVSTILTWVVREGNKFVFGLVMTAQILGFYALATNIASLVRNFVTQFSNKWTFPLYSKLVGDSNLDLMALKIRCAIVGLSSIAVVILGVASEQIIGLIYDDRYGPVAPLVTIIAIGSIGMVVADCYMPIFKAVADSWGLMLLRVMQAFLLIVGVGAGYWWSGVEGIIILSCVTQLLTGPATAWMAKKHFSNGLFLLDSVLYTAPFLAWLYFERDILATLAL